MFVSRNTLFAWPLALAVGLLCACDKEETKSPDDKGKKDTANLCEDYQTCDECIAGQQAKGKDKGEAETQCGSAVLGCWTTWDKPIVCGDKKHDKEPKAEEKKAE